MKKFPLSLLALTTALTLQSPITMADNLFGTNGETTRQDVLRGSITPERQWWDLSHYHLAIEVDPSTRTIAGTNTVSYRVIGNTDRLQIELQPPMKLTKATQKGQVLNIDQDGYSYFIHTLNNSPIGSEQQVVLHFSGKPQVAKRAPWDGGITWKKDSNGIDFIASSNQGIGASIWWPNKDHGYDEPDRGIKMSVEVPEHLVDVSNGRLLSIDHNKEKQTKTYHWQVVNPINNYGVNINIGDYVHFGEKYQGEKGVLDMDYWVLRDNLKKAQEQFKDAKRTIEALEHWFGPYPFYEDSYKLVEAPYLGMEHQSSVTYGNGYQNGYLGRDRSLTGAGMLFDFIIVHETGHEWFANNITSKDIADMWIHESFTNYSESLFLEYHYGKEAAFGYTRGQRINIQNQKPIIGEYHVHSEGSSDMYDKGGNMLHTIRQIVNNDDLWRETLRGLGKQFYHQTVTTQQIEQYMENKTGKLLSNIFDQYLRDNRVPTLEYFLKGEQLRVRWSNVKSGFDMPVKVKINDKMQWLSPTTSWTNVQISQKDPTFVVDKNFYINIMNILGN
ncbi:M1 family metallopeptidase [Thalassotalea sp. 1_MG-2023]|uniref:M1 family metallopeptidase n=1 Tax=Thalassotalea sp. 1_MG-2023 TaxID=3062680 RepID=UPI0026E48C3B|nr:M1 family metallopeptidase [Thalassotalea sp. 1_MG-2023]MDO6426042.1 M1 family metallopeptidase [Thalassotalea sp. 1_MG-2023]